jgi:hypothetical protein
VLFNVFVLLLESCDPKYTTTRHKSKICANSQIVAEEVVMVDMKRLNG